MLDSSRGFITAKGRACYAVTVVFVVLMIVVAGLRVWAKTIVGRHFYTYDYLAFGAFISAIGFTIHVLLAVYPGTLGMHTVDVVKGGVHATRFTLMMFFSGAFFWVTSTTLIKLSLLHFYRAVFLNRAISSARSTILQYVAFGLYILIVSFWTGRVLLSLLMCRPIQKQWDFSLPGHCGNFTAQEISISTINMVLDFSIVLLPMPFLWNLQLPRKKKLAVNVTFSLGICICIINTGRLIIVPIHGARDFTYTHADHFLLSGLEIYVGFICASVPTLASILHRHAVRRTERDRKECIMRCEHCSRKLVRASRRGFGSWLFTTTQDESTDGDDPAHGQSMARSHLEIQRRQEFTISVHHASSSEFQHGQRSSVSSV